MIASISYIDLPCIFYPLLGVVEFLVLFYKLECRILELWPSVSCWSILWVLQDVTALISYTQFDAKVCFKRFVT